MRLDEIPFAEPITIGLAAGGANYLFECAYEKIWEAVGVRFTEYEISVKPLGPLVYGLTFRSSFEEVVYRGGIQPLLAKVLAVSLPSLQRRFLMGIPMSNLTSILGTSIIFAMAHNASYREEERWPRLSQVFLSGAAYGVLKERYGLLCPIIAHVAHNYLVALGLALKG